VGPTGKVYAQNNQYVLQMRDGANEKAMTARLAGDRLTNVKRLDAEIRDLGLAPNSVDAAITALNFHDIYDGSGEEAALGFLNLIARKLKPGGVLGIVDHVGIAGQDNKALHRIEKSLVEAVIEKSALVLEAESDVLANPADDHTQNVFAPGLRGQTDRFVLLLRKPGA
jgi:predicted methyltransferase